MADKLSCILVIIPTLNRANYLSVTLDSLCNQIIGTGEYSVLIVDNGSTDNTKEIVETIIKKHSKHKIRYVYEPEPGLLSGRHRGALEAEGEILVFVDDDIEAEKGWLQAIQDTFDDPTVQIVGGRNLPKYEKEPPDWLNWFWSKHPFGRTCGWLSLLDFGENIREIDANYVWGLNFSIRKSALFELGGFHPDCVPKNLQHFQGDGETALTIKANELGYKAVYQPKALIYHRVPGSRMTYEYFDNRFFYQGVCNSFTDIRRKHGKYKAIERKIKINLKEKIKASCVFRMQKIINCLRKKTEEEKLKERFRQSFSNGYQFHQDAVRKNPELLKWVLRNDYWDYRLPKI